MKLMQRLKKELKQLGPLKRVWLTSFNISIPFVEGHILPAILGEDPPKDRMAYEALQLELSQQGIDFRVFCDRRALEADQFKRTAIQIHPVEVRAFAQLLEGITDRTLFHPKVIYLEDKDGKAVLGAGSANLTVSGWGRNQEVFDFRRVSTKVQQQQIQRLFNGLDRALDLPEQPLEPGDDTDWQFMHSFEPETFLSRLGDGIPLEQLTVWSPYLAEDLPAFVARLQQKLDSPALKLALVPDRIEGHKIRTPWSEELSELLKTGALTFLDYPAPPPDNIEFTHAKLWLAETATQATLAIGSWNFTHPGTSSFTDANEEGGGINIEAGILHRSKTVPAIAGPVLTVGAQDFASEIELEDSELDVESAPPFDLTVTFNWQTNNYTIRGQWYVGEPETGYQLKLPGLRARQELIWAEDRRLQPLNLAIEDASALLARHFYQILSSDGETIRGLIIETGQRYRRAQSFETLKDLFDSLVTNSDPDTNGKLVLHPSLRSDDEPDEALPLATDGDSSEELTYFRLFYAMKQFRARLETCTEAEQLVKWLRVYPGCLQELVEKVRMRLDDKPAAVIDWFLAQEVNTTCCFARERMMFLDEGQGATHLTTEQWRALEVPVPPLPSTNREQRKFIDYIASTSGYQEVSHV
ncbi:phospholipase D-like domain-containing protein [Microbulbifer hydrolyticus]|uniref:Uncharacterized protein n=1 Tax=Microbulbifer hydrolyticus TaxID=48074 RepID=A0A6P1T7J2_9GAMM|nr:phospholipase D-like domain-containing protein [Microbulbifer hydrolyticus]MBB5211491.1 hypothetical protein [Microbulbifer hydrolyticus]QHQ37761.1 hypothetical protein GTQ55_01340 [Microbulbifer hydrolyticus]